ncbi:MAG: hypothetical protein Q7P63_02115 [Verrucomicrobiota bacterium JB022]|nr:hypothetical protein [Verrucomicrobiota bacterium JB022]
MHLPSCCRWFSLLTLVTAASPAWAMTFEVFESPLVESATIQKMNSNGTIFYGYATEGDDAEPRLLIFQEGGTTLLKDFFCMSVEAVSGDGSSIIFYGENFERFFWTEEEEPISLKEKIGLEAEIDISSATLNEDGSVIVGTISQTKWEAGSYWTTINGFRWTVTHGLELFADHTKITAVSADGATVAGNFYPIAGSITSHAFRWSEAGGMERIPAFPVVEDAAEDHFESNWATDISPDGLVVYGTSRKGTATFWGTNVVFSWSKAAGLSQLDEVTNYTPSTLAEAGAAGGVVHTSSAVIDAQTGKTGIWEVIAAAGGTGEVRGLEILHISRDGSVLIGNGQLYVDNEPKEWVSWIIRDYPVPVVQPAIEMVPLDDETMRLVWSPQPGVRHVLQVHNPDGSWTDLATHDASSTEIGPYTYEVAVEDAARYYRVVATKL